MTASETKKKRNTDGLSDKTETLDSEEGSATSSRKIREKRKRRCSRRQNRSPAERSSLVRNVRTEKKRQFCIECMGRKLEEGGKWGPR